MKLQHQARAWRRAFEVQNDRRKDSLQYNLQIKLIIEEYTEVIEAFDSCDPDFPETQAAILKELADLVFVCYQAAANMNWDLDEAIQRVFNSNMSKLGDDKKPMRNELGKILKGPNYQPPNLLDLVDDGR